MAKKGEKKPAPVGSFVLGGACAQDGAKCVCVAHEGATQFPVPPLHEDCGCTVQGPAAGDGRDGIVFPKDMRFMSARQLAEIRARAESILKLLDSARRGHLAPDCVEAARNKAQEIVELVRV